MFGIMAVSNKYGFSPDYIKYNLTESELPEYIDVAISLDPMISKKSKPPNIEDVLIPEGEMDLK